MASRFEFEAIGTSWVIDIPEALSMDKERALIDAIKTRIADFDGAYSRPIRASVMIRSLPAYLVPRANIGYPTMRRP
jgi:hypothetical protein